MPPSATLPTFTPYTFGSMSLGKRVASFDDDIAVARAAMDAGVWFHTSQEYAGGGSFMVLRHAFDQARRQVPSMIFKIRCDRAETIRFDVEDALRRLGIGRIDVAQLCRDAHDHRQIVDDWLAGGPMRETCEDLQSRGLVGHWVFEVFPGFAGDAQKVVEHDLFDGCILYYNPTQRNAPPALWQAMQQRDAPILALRTLGNTKQPPDDAAQAASEKGHTQRAETLRAVARLYAASGCASWPAFCVRFALSTPNVRTTIGGTANTAHLHELIDAAHRFEPLDEALMQQMHALHEQWSQPA